jgi:hypothetical protein
MQGGSIYPKPGGSITRNRALVGTAGAIVGNNMLARALTNPKVVSWLASSAKLPTSALPNAVNQLSKMGAVDPDARDLSAALQQKGDAQ